MLTPIQVAKKANVSVNSVRNWSREYGELVSPAARGEDGVRLFNEADVEVICTIAALRKSGVPPSEIADRIRNQDAPSVVDVMPEPPTQSLQDPANSLQTGAESSLALQLVQSTLQSRLEGIERHLEAQAAEQRDRVQAIERRIEVQAQEAKAAQRDRVTMLVLGGLSGILLTVGTMAVWVWMVGNGGA
jgi:DNA-binding transcriptional MerR regulator